MADKKSKDEDVKWSPIGTVSFPSLSAPDKFGNYGVSLVFRTRECIAELEAEADAINPQPDNVVVKRTDFGYEVKFKLPKNTECSYFDENGDPLEDDSKFVHGKTKARVAYMLRGYDFGGNQGVSKTLNAIQYAGVSEGHSREYTGSKAPPIEEAGSEAMAAGMQMDD